VIWDASSDRTSRTRPYGIQPAHLTQHRFSISKGLRGARANPRHVEAMALVTAVAAETDTSGLGAGCKEGLHGAVVLLRVDRNRQAEVDYF
jgi:hypothetical protein